MWRNVNGPQVPRGNLPGLRIETFSSIPRSILVCWRISMMSAISDERPTMNRRKRMAVWLSVALVAATCLWTGAMLVSLHFRFSGSVRGGDADRGWNRFFSGPAGIPQPPSRHQHLPHGGEPLQPAQHSVLQPPFYGRRHRLVGLLAHSVAWLLRLHIPVAWAAGVLACSSRPPWKGRRGRLSPGLRCSARCRSTRCCGPASCTWCSSWP